MSGFYGSRAMEHWGVFAAFGGGGREIFGTFSFAESWSSDDFGGVTQFNENVKPYLSQVSRTDLTWVPPTAAVATAASSNWALWQQAAAAEVAAGGASDATNYIASISSQMQDLITRGDALSLTGTLGHRSEANEVARYDIFNQIKAVMNKVAASKATATTALNNANAAANVSQLPASTIPPTGSVTYPSATSPAYPTGSYTGADTAAAPASDNTLLYIGLGVGALVLVGGGIFIVKKRRAPAVAGYRRYRRYGSRS